MSSIGKALVKWFSVKRLRHANATLVTVKVVCLFPLRQIGKEKHLELLDICHSGQSSLKAPERSY